MARINLLPWREQQRKQRQKDYLAQLGFIAAIGLACVIGSHVVLAERIDTQNQRNVRLQDEIKLVDLRLQEIAELELTKKALVDRMEVIQQLQESRPEVVHIFDDLVRTLPEGMFLTKIQQKGNTISIDGKTESNARVSTFMRSLENSDWLNDARLLFIEAKEEREKGQPGSNTDIRSFALQVTQTAPGKEDAQ